MGSGLHGRTNGAPIDEGEARKRHVNSAVALAQASLTAEALADKTGEEVLAQAAPSSADQFCSPSKLVKPLSDAGDTHEAATEIGNAIRELLHGEDKYEDRLCLRDDPDGKPRVPHLAAGDAHPRTRTAPGARGRPASALALQARSLDPSAAVPKASSLIGYSRFQLAHTVRDRLVQRGHTPADLIDVRGFIWETLRPRGVQTLDQISF